MKKQLLTAAAFAFVGLTGVQAQKAWVKGGTPVATTTEVPAQRTCGTEMPSQQWEAWMQEKIAERQKAIAEGRMSSVVNYTIPVIVHVIHNGETVGTGTNLSQTQINSQITVLNQDYAGTNSDVSLTPSTFTSALAGATGIQFCMAQQDPSGNALAEPGIDRINRNSKGWTAPPFSNTYVDGTIKPNSIWDPTKYLNMWVCNISGGLLGWATFPAASGLTGIPGSTGTATTDGVVILYNAFGNTGNVSAPYNKGRTATHEVGHWLGLRHIWGDGTCATDYCNDTPAAEAANYNCQTHPFNTASNGGCSGNTTGEMFMNYMDYVPDACMYMFTNDQETRMQTAMANGTYRVPLATSNKCQTAGPAAPVANFTMASTGCTGVAVSLTNSTSGNPTPTYTWSATPNTGVTFSPNANATAPTVTFANPGTYTVQLAASNSQGNNNQTKVITITTCAAGGCDTLTNFTPADTLFVIQSGQSNPGYVAGNNGYGDKKKAEFYSSTGLTSSQVTGGIVLFYRSGTNGTKGTSNINIEYYNGTLAGGPTGTALKTQTVALSTITALTPVNGVTYCGNPALGFTNPIIYPYSFNFSTPQNITQDFYMSVSLPTTTGDTAVVFMTGFGHATNTAWEQWSDNSWHSFNDGTNNTWQIDASLAILPKINCSTGISNDPAALSNNIAMFPNPSNGLVNFVTTLPSAQDLTFNVYNSIGQVVYVKSEKNVTSNMIGLDLTNLNKGVYLVEITTGNGQKVVKRIVLN